MATLEELRKQLADLGEKKSKATEAFASHFVVMKQFEEKALGHEAEARKLRNSRHEVKLKAPEVQTELQTVDFDIGGVQKQINEILVEEERKVAVEAARIAAEKSAEVAAAKKVADDKAAADKAVAAKAAFQQAVDEAVEKALAKKE